MCLPALSVNHVILLNSDTEELRDLYLVWIKFRFFLARDRCQIPLFIVELGGVLVVTPKFTKAKSFERLLPPDSNSTGGLTFCTSGPKQGADSTDTQH